MYFERIYAAVEANETELALDHLEALFDLLKPATETLVLMRADISELRQLEANGTLEKEDASIRTKRLNKRILDLAGIMEEDITDLGLRKIKISRESLDRQLRAKLKGVYRIEEKPLREGNTSVIYKGEDLGSRQYVAIRAIKQQNFFDPLVNTASSEALEEEISRLLGLKHRHLINILGAHLDSFPASYVEEFIHGPTLDRLMHLGPWPVTRVIALMRQVSQALYYLHTKGITHGRIRPYKVFLDHEGMATLSPFDVINLRSKHWGLKGFQTELQYFSPEELMHIGEELTPTTDQFCLGVLALTLLKGGPLFGPGEGELPEGMGTMEFIYLARKTFLNSRRKRLEILRPFNLPNRFREILLRMCAKDPRDRFPSMKAVLDALDDLRFPRKAPYTLVQDSYHRACANHNRLIKTFYLHLFDRYPDIKAHFDNWEHTQGVRRAGSLEIIVQHAIQLLLAPDPDTAYFSRLKDMPEHLGISIEQYEQFISCLIEIIQSYDFLWDLDTAHAWGVVRQKALEHMRPSE